MTGQVQVKLPLPTSFIHLDFNMMILALIRRLVRELLGAGEAPEALLRCRRAFGQGLSTLSSLVSWRL